MSESVGKRHRAAMSIADQTRSSLSRFSPSERKVARVLLASYPVAGLETIAELAQAAGVSSPTVLRFVARLGYDSYPSFQRSLRREVNEQMGSPLLRMDGAATPGTEPNSLPNVSQVFIDAVAQTFAHISDDDIIRAARLLADPRLQVRLVGGRFSRVLAMYLTAHLTLMRPNVRMLPDTDIERATALLDLGKRDLLVAFDYRRYDETIVETARDARAHGARVILFTDPWLSPAADYADMVLSARVDAPSPFDSLVAPMALVEAIVASAVTQLGDSVRTRLEKAEARH